MSSEDEEDREAPPRVSDKDRQKKLKDLIERGFPDSFIDCDGRRIRLMKRK